jgi:hypothetical protein
MTGWGIVAALAIWAACIVAMGQMLGFNRLDEDDDREGR